MFNVFLKNLGFNPSKQTGTSTVYKSPFNPHEKTPSFFIFLNKKWDCLDRLKKYNYKDFSSGNGGDIYNFAMKYFNVGFVDAKKKIEEVLNQPCKYKSEISVKTNQIEQQQQQNKKKNKIKIIKIRELQNKTLINYLASRKISVGNAQRFVKEIYYEIDKRYFGIAFQNISNGIETRNKYFKGSFGKKDISLLLLNQKDKRLKIFEGFMDFLSYLEINKSAKLSNYLILNSVSLKERAINEVKGRFLKYELYLDNDRAGNDTTKYLQQELQNAIDKRPYYKRYEDINDFLISNYNM
jgi:hypothetical protein